MTSEDRNFRYGYYEKVGFGGIDDKKQLELLLREKPPDLLSRLSQLAFRYTLSVAQRKQVWQLLLDVISPENQITEARIEIQREIVHDIFAGLSLMQLVDESILSVKQIDYSCTGQPRVLVLAFLVESKQLNLDSKHQLQTVEVIDLMSLGEVFAREFLQKNSPHSLQDTYWIFRHFICCVRSNLGALIETYEKFVQNLANEDKVLHVHLMKNGILKQCPINGQSTNNHHHVHSTTTQHSLSPHQIYSGHQNIHLKYKIATYRPIITWFIRFFAGIIHHNFLIRVLDKVIGCLIHGSRPFYVLISVGKALLMHSRDRLLLLTTTDELVKHLLSPLSIEDSEQIVLKAFST